MTPRILHDFVTTAATCLDQERSSLMMIPRYLNSDTFQLDPRLIISQVGFPHCSVYILIWFAIYYWGG